MGCYEYETSNEEPTKTISVTDASEEAITNYAKKDMDMQKSLIWDNK